jgi:5-(carboxyamino)imidazole ribonucleotide mutase
MEYKKTLIGVGSKSDRSVALTAKNIFDYCGVPYDAFLVSADRTPERARKLARRLREGEYLTALLIGGKSFILPAVIAVDAPTKTVYAVPVSDKGAPLGGMDALFSVTERPADAPVACFGINRADNAALHIVQWYAELYPEAGFGQKIIEYKAEQAKSKGYDQEEFPWSEPEK